MRIQVLHDRSGAILAALVRTEGERAGTLIPVEESQELADVDAPDLDMTESERRGDEPSRQLAELVEHYRFEDGRLVRRGDPAS
jgi:hypothetical protein